MAKELTSVDRGITEREEFETVQQHISAETAMAAVTAREQARIQAAYIMAERHPRDWMRTRARLLEHCARPGFADVARYCKPTGRQLNKQTGQWEDTFAEGLSARFAEVARQEMGNLYSSTSVVYDDDKLRIVRAEVLDLQNNIIDAREIAIAKVTEKRGKQDRKTKEWEPPDGRELLGQRVNTNGDPVYVVRATDDEVRLRQNSEISKSQRDETLRMIPKDIRDECEARILATLRDPSKVDVVTVRKRLVDAFRDVGVSIEELTTYVGRSIDTLTLKQITELKGLYAAIKDNEITMAQALRAKYDQPGTAEESEAEGEKKLAALKDAKPDHDAAKADELPSEEEMNRVTQARVAEEARATGDKPPLQFGRRQK
jgi:hypothetical protein